MTNDELDKLKELAERATRKWFRAGRPDMQSYDAETGRPFKNLYNDDIAETSEAARIEGENSINDSQYIAGVSPDVILGLITEVKRLQSNLTEMEAIAKSWMEDCDKLQEKYEPQSAVLSGNLTNPSAPRTPTLKR